MGQDRDVLESTDGMRQEECGRGTQAQHVLRVKATTTDISTVNSTHIPGPDQLALNTVFHPALNTPGERSSQAQQTPVPLTITPSSHLWPSPVTKSKAGSTLD